MNAQIIKMPKIPRKPLPFPEASPNDASPANETAETTVTVNDGAAAMGDNNAVAGRQGVAVQGDVGGDIITGTVIVKNYLRRTGLVDEWYREAEKPYLQRVQKEFAQSLSKKPLDSNDEIAAVVADRYVPVSLNRRVNDGQGQSNRSGEWGQLVTYPCVSLLLGGPYDGKSSLMRKIAYDLAKMAEAEKDETKRYLPIYLPINRYPFANANPDELLNLAAFACGASPGEMQVYWREQKRSICLLIDNVDEIPEQNNERNYFFEALTALVQTRSNATGAKKHSLIVACRPDNGSNILRTRLADLFASQNDYAEWSILPLAEEQISRLLAVYDVPSELSKLIKDDIHVDADAKAQPSKYWRLVNKPGLIATLGKATSGSGMSNLPRNTVELCELFIRRLVDQDEDWQRQSAADKPFYAYAQVKKPVLGRIAFRMLLTGQNNLFLDDDLCRELAQYLDKLSQTFNRIRRYLPENWHIADFLAALQQTPIANAEAAQNGYFEFASTLYRDYFAALHLDHVSAEKPEQLQTLVADILKSGRERWEDVFIFLADMSNRSDSASKLMDLVFAGSEGSAAAADLWLEKGNSQTSRIPSAVSNEYFRRRQVVEEPNLVVPPLAIGLTRLARHRDARVALQAVNMLARFGLGAVLPLLDAVSYPNPFVSASAMHALLHLGPRIANEAVETVAPLIDIDETSLRFNNGGSGNATIGPCVLVDVPQTFRAEVQANLSGLDFDPFTSACSFKLWHEPVTWFALDYFKQKQVNWIGLAVACDTVKRVSGTIIQKALIRTGLDLLVDELEWCLNSYGRVGDRITRALKLTSDNDAAAFDERLAWIFEGADLTYTELRLLFDRLNRSGRYPSKSQDKLPPPPQNIIKKQRLVDTEIKNLDANIHRVSDQATNLPDLHEFPFIHSSAALQQSELIGISIGRLLPSGYQVAETISLHGQIDIGNCVDSHIKGIAIAEAHGWAGIRTSLALNIQQLQNSTIEGIVVKPTEAALKAAA